MPGLVLHLGQQDRLAAQAGRGEQPVALGLHADDLRVRVLGDLADQRLPVALGHPVARLDPVVGGDRGVEVRLQRRPRRRGRSSVARTSRLTSRSDLLTGRSVIVCPTSDRHKWARRDRRTRGGVGLTSGRSSDATAGRPARGAPLTARPRRPRLPPTARSTPPSGWASTSCARCSCDRLQWTLRHAYENVPHYRAAFDAAGVHPDDCRELADLAKFPTTSKADLRENYPFGMFAVPQEQVRRVHASSRHHRPAHRRRLHRARHRHLGHGHGPLDPRRRRPARATCCTTPTATACSPAGSARTTARRSWAAPSSRSPAA